VHVIPRRSCRCGFKDLKEGPGDLHLTGFAFSAMLRGMLRECGKAQGSSLIHRKIT
jgi:hypothetical protein